MLALTLQKLQAHGFVRCLTDEVLPPRVDHSLTLLGLEDPAHIVARVGSIEVKRLMALTPTLAAKAASDWCRQADGVCVCRVAGR